MKTFRFLALAGVLGVTSWLSTQPRVEAHNYPQCQILEASPCGTQSTTTKCWMAPNPNDIRTCYCWSDHVWHCPIYS